MKTQRPGLKWMRRSDRLLTAKQWAENYTGKRLVKGYSKHFGIDMICAITELKMANVPIEPAYEKAIRDSVQARIDEKKKSSENKRLGESEYGVEFGYNEDLSFIAGFTDGGVAYGIAVHEIEGREIKVQEDKSFLEESNNFKTNEDLQFYTIPDNDLPF